MMLVGVGGKTGATLTTALTAGGYTVVAATLCGFAEGDTAFPSSYKGMAATSDIAQNLNRW